jgi:serine/threonine protein kinase
MTGDRVQCDREWIVGDRIGSGGFGAVYAAVAADDASDSVAIKFVPQDVDAGRDLLFVDLGEVPNVVPVLDSGEHAGHWVIVMPRAVGSLRDRLDRGIDDPVAVEEIARVMRDVATALAALQNRVVHRDIKPENLLELDEAWCLADFGISRYAEATTGPDTQKFALSPPYAAPERWRNDRASTATDVYSLGIIAYEMAAGHRPFPGPAVEDYREQHLSQQPARLSDVPDGLAAIIDECLYKAPETRPQPANLLARVERVGQSPGSAGLQALAAANRSEVERQSEHVRRQSKAQTEAERRTELIESAQRSFEAISEVLVSSIEAVASAAQVSRQAGGAWRIHMNNAELVLPAINTKIAASGAELWNNRVVFDLVAFSEVSLSIPADQYGYEGREHSLWFGDIQQPGAYGWFETAFMVMPLIQKRGRQEPFALNPGREASEALVSGVGAFQLARPFVPLVVGELDDFVDRWAAWFALAAQGQLAHPGGLPEHPGQGSWRQG